MGELYFEKFANFDRAGEPASVCMPFGAGWVFDGDLARFGVDEAICQARPLSFWHDGSIKWLKVDFLADLPANGDCRYAYGFDNRGIAADSISVFDNDGELIVDNGAIRVVLGNAAGDKPFKSLARGDYCADKISAPYVTLDGQICPAILAAPWEISESGSVLVKLTARGNHGDTDLGFVITIT
ncbi:MAG: hypothetical protein FWB71_04330, partial [Defluviitaleaceae bacterium]|nr:hypothetical protein [Defluviitaleaceae bacterium]